MKKKSHIKEAPLSLCVHPSYTQNCCENHTHTQTMSMFLS